MRHEGVKGNGKHETNCNTEEVHGKDYGITSRRSRIPLAESAIKYER